MSVQQLLKVGLGPEEWLKLWESGFTHDHSQESDSTSGGHGHHEHEQEHEHEHGENEEHGHSTVSEVDNQGNMLIVDSYLFRNIHRCLSVSVAILRILSGSAVKGIL